MQETMHSAFEGRTFFITGGTGFVGKVLLFKILKEVPEVKRIYLLMRGKKSRKFQRYLTAQERLDLEVMGSPCFVPLQQRYGDAAWRDLCGKVKAMEGDITLDHIGLSAADRRTLSQEVHYIIHLAATVNFNEKLHLAVQMNTLGGLRVLSLAKTCPKLEAMVHTSTCYVNYPRDGRDVVNEERLYPLPFDAEEMCLRVLGITEQEVARESAQVLQECGFANTYTFTKNIGERLLQRYKEDVPICIVRPSIIGCSYAEPMPGWVDALTAAGGLLLTSALGVVRELACNPALLADVIPVDFVVNVMLKALHKTRLDHKARRPARPAAGLPLAGGEAVAVAVPAPLAVAVGGDEKLGVVGAATTATTTATAAAAAVAPRAEEEAVLEEREEVDWIPIYQAATTGTENRVSWGRVKDSLMDYTRNRKHPKALSKADILLTPNSALYHFRYWTMRYMPYLMLKAAVALPEPLGSPKRRALVEKLGRAVRRADLLNTEFRVFVMKEWVFDCKKARALDDGLTPEERQTYLFSPFAINWYSYTQVYAYGIFKHIVRDTGAFPEPKVPLSPAEMLQKAASL